MFKPSSYQQAIFDHITNGKGHLCVSAVAGSGKTTTIVEAAHLVKGRLLFLAFNKKIVEELDTRLPDGVTAKTVHSYGYYLIRKRIGKPLKMQNDKYSKILKEYFEDHPEFWNNILVAKGEDPRDDAVYRKDILGCFGDYFEKARVTLSSIDTPIIEELRVKYGLDDVQFILLGCQMEVNRLYFVKKEKTTATELFLSLLRWCFERGEELAKEGIIDYTDMIYIPVYWKAFLYEFDWIFVDEAQDLSPASRELILGIGKKARMVFVGDPYQAIMGFAGADYASYREIQQQTNATELPLSVCYRCPSNIISLAATIVPHIEGVKGKGVLCEIGSILETVEVGDMVLSRTNAPLVSLCYKLWKHGIPANIVGTDFAKSIESLARKIEKQIAKIEADDYKEAFLIALESWLKNEEEKAKKDKKTHRLIIAKDKFDVLMVLMNGLKVFSVDSLTEELNRIFDDNPNGKVWLSSVHRSKGLERDRVFIINPHFLPLRFRNSTKEQLEQEKNLLYVAVTRAKKELFIVWDGEKYEWQSSVRTFVYEEVSV